MTRARIVGTGMAVPDKVLTNADIEKMVDTSDEAGIPGAEVDLVICATVSPRW